MKRPLVIVALLYGSGLLLGDNFHAPLLWLFASAFALLIGAFVWRRDFILWPLIILAGWINLGWRAEVLAPNDLRKQLTKGTEYVRLRGTLNAAPTHRVFEMDEEQSWRTLAQIEVSHIQKSGAWRPAVGTVIISTPGIVSAEFHGGQETEVTGVIQVPRSPLAPGLFDYQTYLKRQGIYFQLAVASTNDWQLIGASKNAPFADRCIDWAQNCLSKGLGPEDESLRLVWAMTLGWKTALTDEVSEPFMRSGTMHVFAISGLHIALISGILIALLRVMQLPRSLSGVIAIALVWFYTAATGWQPSAIRSTVMMTIIVGGWALRRPTDLLNSLAAAAFIILIWNPQQLFQASFQLSFFVVLSIALFLPIFLKHRECLLKSDPLLPPELRPTWRKRLDLPLNYLTTCFATSLAAWLGSLPLVAYYFHLFTPISLLANLVIVPLASLALMSNIGSLFCASWFPFAAELFNHAGWFFMKLMSGLSHWFATRPGSYFYVPAPSLAACLIYYALLLITLNGWFRLPRKRIFALTIALGALLFSLWSWRTESQTVKMTILPLNGGSAIFVDAPGRENDLLIDCGDSHSADLILKPFLRAQGVNKISNVLLTHGDLRHVGGYETIKTNFTITHTFTSPLASRSAAYREILTQLKTKPEDFETVSTGSHVRDWAVLHPQAEDQFAQADDKAIVLRGHVFGKSVLLLASLGRPGQNALTDREDNLRTDIVVSGIPTQKEPLCDALLELIQPTTIIVTDSEFPATKRASRKLRERLGAQKARLIFCRDSGAITLVFKRDDCKIETALGD